jgi:hypothetical protein
MDRTSYPTDLRTPHDLHTQSHALRAGMASPTSRGKGHLTRLRRAGTEPQDANRPFGPQRPLPTATVVRYHRLRVALGQQKGSKRSKLSVRNPAQIRRQKTAGPHE